MEPKLPMPNFNPEQPQAPHPQNKEVAPGVMPDLTPGRGIEQVGERPMETVADTSVDSTLPAPAAPLVLPLNSPKEASQPVIGQTDDNPIVAADEDLIEKEWVDKAKKIVEETKDDPYRREQEVGKLQADYLRKRYGKELGAA